MSDLPPPPPPGGGYDPPAGYGAGMPMGTPPLAEMGPRVVAALIDLVAIPVAGWIALFILGAIFGAVSDALGAIVLLVGWVALIGYSLFYVPYMDGTTGQTIGKKQQNIKLVGAENGGQPIGFPMAFVRYLINSFCILFYLLAFADAQRQTVGDKVSKSIVVNA